MERLSRYRLVAGRLARLSDRRLRDAVAGADALGTGIGGRSARLDAGGVPVFVKRIPLTDLEARAEHAGSTANLFGLPTYYQYGVGSAGFGAWRELAAHTMTTAWVLRGECTAFPLLYHWRVLPDSPPVGFADEFGGVEAAVRYWEGSPAVRTRLTAIGGSSASLVLFLEHLPHTLADRLARRGEPRPYSRLATELADTSAFMRARGLVHFDAHLGNILTDGRALYFADFGLALSARFRLSPAESAFLSTHRDYDRHLVASQLLRPLVADLRGGSTRDEFLRAWLDGRRPHGVSAEHAAVIDRHAATTLVLDRFHRRLLAESRRTPYPAAELERCVGNADSVC